MPYDSCSLQVIQGNRLVIVNGRGFDDIGGLLGVGFDLDDETSLNSQVVRSGRPQVFADVSQNPHFASEQHGGGRIRGWICAPMIVGDRTIGVLSIDKFEADFFTEELAELATASPPRPRWRSRTPACSIRSAPPASRPTRCAPPRSR